MKEQALLLAAAGTLEDLVHPFSIFVELDVKREAFLQMTCDYLSWRKVGLMELMLYPISRGRLLFLLLILLLKVHIFQYGCIA
jgi:hypothetical protein